MPVTEIGLADVEERLRGLCRRINTVSVLHGASVCLTTILIAAALRIALGPARFGGGLAWLSVAACVGAVTWAAVYVRGNWVDVAQAAHIVDRQAELHERVTTLFTVGPTAARNRLLPLLLTQALDLGERWQPQRLVPKAYPKSIYMVALALLSLAASPLVEANLPPIAVPQSPSSADAKATVAQEEGAEGEGQQAMQLAALSGDGEESAAEGAQQGHGSSAASAKGGSDEVRGKLTGNQPSADAKPSAMLGSVPESLRRSLLGAPSDGDSKGDGGRAPGKGPQGEDEEDDRKGEGRTEAPNPGLGKATKPDTAAEKHDQKGAELPAPNAMKAPADAKMINKESPNEPEGTKQGGSAPGAGKGSESGNLLTVRGGEASADAPATGTFKLTLNSFLNALEDKHSTRDHDSKRNSTTVTVDRPAHAFNDHQLDDDALRKASIPAEYEELVKRVYSRSEHPRSQNP